MDEAHRVGAIHAHLACPAAVGLVDIVKQLWSSEVRLATLVVYV